MKKYIYISLISVLSVFTACTDVIDVDVPTADPRLVIEASIDWEKGTLGHEQTIKLSTTTPYFETDTPNAVTGAQVSVTRLSNNQVFEFSDNNDGTYTTTVFEPALNEEYTLNVIYENETFTATETLRPTTSFTNVSQSLGGGFFPDELEVNVYWNDPADETNFYILKFLQQGERFPRLVDISDEFLNGNEIHIFYEKNDTDEGFEPGDVVDINLYNVSERYYNYIQLLNSQSGSGNPFAPTPVELRGNCINITNADNYPYGYFRVTQTDKASYTFVEE
ncbi:DUF4249 domain-containing protein [Formosa haliotis]|uniref:DUF4249 domain-containing protein n=1 Tax=Formosa haliotis TaxID=1555194 RepID=UPI0008252EEC|nr:DUF4249 domain-containing protein [Formosa haliotis]